MGKKLPILLIAFNRIHTTKLVLEQIKEYRPERIYISVDAARNTAEALLVDNVITLIRSKLDWDCRVKYKIAEKNLGCREACTSAIDWFFSYEEYGVILEDDCVPNQSFFDFVRVVLAKRVLIVVCKQASSSNGIPKIDRGKA